MNRNTTDIQIAPYHTVLGRRLQQFVATLAWDPIFSELQYLADYQFCMLLTEFLLMLLQTSQTE